MLHAEVTEEGTAVIPSDEVASLGARPGDHLRLRLVVEPKEPPATTPRKSLYGALRLGRSIPYEVFEEASRQAIADAEPKEWPS